MRFNMKLNILSFGLVVVFISGCQLPEKKEAHPPLREKIVETRTLFTEDSTKIEYEAGIMQVPVNRQDPSSDTWGIEFVRLKQAGTASPDTPPIFVLRGGPGSTSGTELLERSGYYDRLFAPYVEVADVVIPGQRGLRTSNPTPCESMQALTLEEAMDEEAWYTAHALALELCRSVWETKGVDLQGFNVVEMAADVFDIARGLGYGKIQLVGQSFGSHWGMSTIREYPELVARATFSGLEGPDHTYDMPGYVFSTLQRIAESAEASSELGPFIPEEGLLSAFQALIDTADESPISVTGKHPETGEDVELVLDGDDFRWYSRGYSRGTSWRYVMAEWPLDLLKMIDGDYSGLTESFLNEYSDTEVRNAAYFQIDCASGISVERGEALRSDPAAAFLGKTWRYYDSSCEAWDADLGEDFRAAFTTDVPALLIQGDWDTSTPFENGLEVRTYFKNHRFVHVEGGSHGAFREARETEEGFTEKVHTWMATGNFGPIPERVVLPPLQWKAPGD